MKESENNNENPLSLTGLHNIRQTTWRLLRPGMVVLHGFTLNGSTLPELMGYPVLTSALVEKLYTRYRLLHNRTVIVADIQPGFHAYDISHGIREKQERLTTFNAFRNQFNEEKSRILSELNLPPDLDLPLFKTEYVERDILIKDTYNSFSYLYGLENPESTIPSLLDHLDLVLSLGDLLTNRLTGKFSIPDDREVMLHLVVDYSRSMESAGKLEIALSCIDVFEDFISKIMKKTRIQLYAFSDICRPVDRPLSSREMEGGETNYASFMKKILHLRDRDVHNKVILFTDGRPSDKTEAIKMASLFKKNKIDYTQLVFDIREEQREEIIIDGSYDLSLTVDSIIRDEDLAENMTRKTLDNEELDAKMTDLFKDFTDIAEAAGGNQIIVKINSLIKMVSIECYDRYMGLLTLFGKNSDN